jgi:hypothetical protein
MSRSTRDLIFLSDSRKDEGIYQKVRQKLLDRGRWGSLWLCAGSFSMGMQESEDAYLDDCARD